MPIHVVEPDEGGQSGGPIRCRIVEDGSHTQHRLGIIEAALPPGPVGPPRHVHRDHDEIFLVTEGRLRSSSGDAHVDAEVGSCATIPAGPPHTFLLPAGEQGRLDPADVGRAMAKYATDVIR
jgi:mannose-6-phosphate isomerase-like protein (cupin superfamily)